MREPKTLELPPEVTNALRILYSALRGADNVAELPFGQPSHNNDLTWSIALVAGYRAVLRVDHSRTPKNSAGGVDWARVYRVQLRDIEAGHA